MGVATRAFHPLQLTAHEVGQGIGISQRPNRVAVGIPDHHQSLAIELGAYAVLGNGAILVHDAGVGPAIQYAAEDPGAEQHGHDHRQRHQRQQQLRGAPRARPGQWIRGWRYCAGTLTGHFRLQLGELGLPLGSIRLVRAKLRHFPILLVAAMAAGARVSAVIDTECRLGNFRTFRSPQRMAIADS